MERDGASEKLKMEKFASETVPRKSATAVCCFAFADETVEVVCPMWAVPVSRDEAVATAPRLELE